jgi:hypothetical protein
VKTAPVVFEEAADVSLGQAGIFMPASAYSGRVQITRIDPTPSKYSTLRQTFVYRWMDFRILDSKGNEFEKLFGLVYVYFNLDGQSLADWEDGDLSIYRFSEKEDRWVECPSRLLENENAPHGRLACFANEFGVYGLGTPR